ncbi:hypothetical protein FOXB_10972, partial [Fusarium oxysporum f. sp. conglutinans Fo5176]
RVLIVCAGGCVGIQDVEFPQGSQLEINGQAFKADFLGLKNKPGSVRPIDITDILRLRPNYTNNVKFTYGPTKRAPDRFSKARICKHKVRNGNAPSAGRPHLLRSWRSILTYCNDTDPVTSDIKPISHDRVTKPKAATPTNSMASHGESSPGLRGASINGKRRKDPVDLTLSDDEDARPLSKRRNTSGNL